MKYIRKMLLIVLCMSACILCSISVLAQDEKGLEQYENIVGLSQAEGNITDKLVPQVMRGFYEPTKAHDWNDGEMKFEGDTSVNTELYTEKYFTDFTEGNLYVYAATGYNLYPRYDVTVRMYKKGFLFDEEIFKEEVKAGESLSLHIWNYDPDAKYYLKFSGTFHVTGYISKTK